MSSDQTADSKVSEHQITEVFDTPEHENPAYGSTSIRIRSTSYSSTVVRISRANAKALRDQLNAHLETEATN